MKQSKLALFSKITLVSIFLVILAGGVVRMTGSGMGCPDWPKCFDCYIPPTSVDQLPDNYKEIYSAKREKKINRFAKFLTALGFENKAQELLADKSLLEEQDFNPLNTWTEYTNRLSGALAGMLIFAQMVWLFRKFKKHKAPAILAVLLVFTTGFQAWLGAMVVATQIVPWVLTVHMILAIVMIVIQLHIIKGVAQRPYSRQIPSPFIFYTALAGVVIMIVQTVLGTQVRQQIDVLQKTVDREFLMAGLVGAFPFHRTMALVLLALGGLLVWKNKTDNINRKAIYGVAGVIFLEAIVGKLFDILGMPVYLQPAHLLLSMLLFTLMYQILITSKLKR